MKNLLLATTAAFGLAGAAHAQMTLVGGSASINYGAAQFFDSTSVYNLDVNSAWSLGNFGVQAGAQVTLYDPSGNSSTSYAADAHFYRQTANGNKYGGFVNILGGNNGGNLYDVGVEAMLSFGMVDVEASTGVWYNSFSSGTDTGSFDLAAYYAVTDNIEINASMNSIYQIGGPGFIALYQVGAAYEFPSNGLVASAGYGFYNEGSADLITVGLGWKFGPNQDERLFNHGSGLLSGAVGF